MAASAKTFLITGAAGFIGSHLCERFLSSGSAVIAVDNFLTGSRKNIDLFKPNPKFKFIEHDISRPLKVEGPVDYVLHFASPASPPDYLKFPLETLRVGSSGTENALEIAREKKSRFLLASTSEVYGDPLVHPQREDYWGNVNSIGPRSVYDEAKRYAEAISMAYWRTYKVDVKILRIFNTYGPRMRLNDGRAIPVFIKAVLEKQPLAVFGDGKQTRSFCYVDDLIDGIEKLLFSNLNEPVNLGNPNEKTILELAEAVLKITGSKLPFKYFPLPQDDPKVRKPDITKAQTKLGWQPKVSLEDGLKKTIKYFTETHA